MHKCKRQPREDDGTNVSFCAYSALEALLAVPSFCPQLIIADVIMPEKTGIDLASELRTSVPELPIILLSGNAGTEELLRQSGMQHDGVLVLAKPFPRGNCFESLKI